MLKRLTDDHVHGKHINWIRLFRMATGANLQVARDFYDLLRFRGYEVNTLASIVQAMNVYHYYMAGENNDIDSFGVSLRVALDILRKSALANSSLIDELIADDFAMPRASEEEDDE